MSRLTIVVVTLLLSLGTARAACTDAAAVAATRAAADTLCPCGQQAPAGRRCVAVDHTTGITADGDGVLRSLRYLLRAEEPSAPSPCAARHRRA